MSIWHLTTNRYRGIFRRSFHPMGKGAGRGAHGPRNGTCVATDVGIDGSGWISPIEGADATGSSFATHHRFLSAHFPMDNHHTCAARAQGTLGHLSWSLHPPFNAPLPCALVAHLFLLDKAAHRARIDIPSWHQPQDRTSSFLGCDSLYTVLRERRESTTLSSLHTLTGM